MQARDCSPPFTLPGLDPYDPLRHRLLRIRAHGVGMTNKIAIILAVIIIGLLVFDWQEYGWSNSLFLARKFADLVEWVAFWR